MAAILSWTELGFAEPSDDKSPADQAVAAASDLVVLKNGNRYRGTIAELVKDESVTIVLMTGEKRSFDFADVEYAGAASGESTPRDSAAKPRPATESKAAPVPAGSHRVRFTSTPMRMHFTLRTKSDPDFHGDCLAPCSLILEEDDYRVALRAREKGAVLGSALIAIDEPLRVSAHYRSRAGVRSAGGIVLLVSLSVLAVTGTYLAAADSIPAPLVVAALSPGFVGGIVGLSLGLVSDKVEFRTVPWGR